MTSNRGIVALAVATVALGLVATGLAVACGVLLVFVVVARHLSDDLDRLEADGFYDDDDAARH